MGKWREETSQTTSSQSRRSLWQAITAAEQRRTASAAEETAQRKVKRLRAHEEATEKELTRRAGLTAETRAAEDAARARVAEEKAAARADKMAAAKARDAALAAQRVMLRRSNDTSRGTKRKAEAVEEDVRPVRSRRYKIKPLEHQRRQINNWLGCVSYLKNHLFRTFPRVMERIKVGTLRNACKTEELFSRSPWLISIPESIRDCAVSDFKRAQDAHFAKYLKARERGATIEELATMENARFRFKNKKKESQTSFTIQARNWVNGPPRGGGPPTKTIKVLNKATGVLEEQRVPSGTFGGFRGCDWDLAERGTRLPETVEGAVRVVRERLGGYFVCIPYRVEIKSESQAPKSGHGAVALDPGVRTFQTTYDADGCATAWGAGDMGRIVRLGHHADALESRIAQARATRKRATSWGKYTKQGSFLYVKRLEKARLRIFQTIRNLVKELHRKLIHWLVNRYRVILLPDFRSSAMASRGSRKISSSTARAMMTWSHHAFKQRLLETAELYSNVTVLVVQEPYTSKTCGACGEIKNDLGGAKRYRCTQCGFCMDRDVNGARNILLRYLTLYCEDDDFATRQEEERSV